MKKALSEETRKIADFIKAEGSSTGELYAAIKTIPKEVVQNRMYDLERHGLAFRAKISHKVVVWFRDPGAAKAYEAEHKKVIPVGVTVPHATFGRFREDAQIDMSRAKVTPCTPIPPGSRLGSTALPDAIPVYRRGAQQFKSIPSRGYA